MLEECITVRNVAYIKQDVNDSSLLGCYALSLSKQFVTFHVKDERTRLVDSQIRI